jgi:hypothetical protein
MCCSLLARSNSLAGILLLLCVTAHGQVIVGDSYNVTDSGTGFGLNAGVNSGINPPTTRLTGTAAANLRYLLTATTKATTAYSIAGSKLRVTSAANPGRFSLSANGTTAFDFAPALGSGTASPQQPVVYDLAISMANNSAGTQRFSFALATAEGDATTWDFGIQLYRTADTDNFYTIGKRIDIGSSGVAADLNTYITNTVPGTYGSEVSFLIRVTDAGAETTTYHSRVQLSLDGGHTWIYDTASDPDLPNGWRLNGAGRYVLWDIAPDAGNVTYDNFSLSPVPVAAQLLAPPNNTANVGAGASLKVAVSNTAPGAVTVTFYGHEAPKPGPGPDFLIPVMPDTQNYSDYTHDGLHVLFYEQTEWIVTNRVQQNIAYVAQLGDIVQNGDQVSGSPNNEEWQVATNAMYRLENPTRTLLAEGIPYGCAVGNHDQEPNGDEDGTTTNFNRYFGTPHFSGKSYYGGHYGTNNDSFYNLFSAGGMDFIVFSPEFGRYGSGVLDWFDGVLAAYPNRRIIVMTHHAGSDYTPSSFSAQGQAIFDRLKTNPNFFLMLGGHVFNGTGWGEGSRSDTVSGHTIHTLISDYQNRPSGGDGLMRLMYFSPSNNTVSIKTYSPSTDSYETDADSQFSFSYNMQPNGAGSPGTPYIALGTNSSVAPGSLATLLWPGLQAGKTYEWYVTVTDAGGHTVLSPSSQFTTTVNAAPVVTNRTIAVVGDQPTALTLYATDANGDALTFQTNSLPLHGLNSNFNPASGTFTYAPSRGYRGFDQFTFKATDSVATSSVATLVMNVGAPADVNGNGLPDAWEAIYGITDANADADGDGQSNLAEYLAGTNPTNAVSVFKLLSAAQDNNGFFGLTWSSVGGTRYRVQYSNADVRGGLTSAFTDIVRSLASEIDSSPYGAASTQSFTDTLTLTGPPTNNARYYRIQVVP